MVYDALEMTYRTVQDPQGPEPPKPITELIDYDAFCGVVSDEAAGRRGRAHDLGAASSRT